MSEDTLLNKLSAYHKKMQQADTQERKNAILCQLVLILFPLMPSQEVRDDIAEILREYNS